MKLFFRHQPVALSPAIKHGGVSLSIPDVSQSLESSDDKFYANMNLEKFLNCHVPNEYCLYFNVKIARTLPKIFRIVFLQVFLQYHIYPTFTLMTKHAKYINQHGASQTVENLHIFGDFHFRYTPPSQGI